MNNLIELNPIQELLNQPRITKKDIETLSFLITEQIFDFSNGQEALILIDSLKKVIDGVDKNLRAKVSLKENDVIRGVKIEKSSSPTKLNYEEDSKWAIINNQLKGREDLLKSQFKLRLKNLGNTDFVGIVDEGGEQVPVVNIKSGGGEIIKLTYPKE